MKVKTHTFNGRKYKIEVDPDGANGVCDQYSPKDRYLQIFTDLDRRKGLITAIHEALHAESWTKSEKIVDRVSREIGMFLWNLGYRRTK